MPIVYLDGYKYFDYGLRSFKLLTVETDKLDRYIEYINEKRVSKIAIWNDFGYKRADIEFLTKCPHIKFLSISSVLIKDYSPIYSLTNLEHLSFGQETPSVKVDLGKILSLESFGTNHFANIFNIGKCVNLKQLRITSYNPATKNLEELSGLKNLDLLDISRSTINSLKGLGNLKNIKRIDLFSMPKLCMLDELEQISNNLVILRFENCKNIKNFDYIARLTELKLLSFDNCGKIPSVGFIKLMPKLKAFVFVGSDVIDGDLSPCIGLDYVAFSDKKHYSHKSKDFPTDNASIESQKLFKYGEYCNDV